MLWAIALTAAAGAAVRGQAGEGTAAGALVLNGTRTPLQYVYAAAKPGFFDKTTDDIHILLSDVALDEAARDDMFALSRLARDDKAHVVEVVLDATGDPISGAIYAREFNGMVSLSGIHVFERQQFERSVVAGRLRTREADDFAGVRFEYDATFRVPVERPPTAEEIAAALESPPAFAARAYLRALLGGDRPAFLRTLTAAHRASYDGSDGYERFAELRAGMPADTVPARVTRRGNAATVSVEGHDGGIIIEYVLELVVEEGEWRIAN